MDGIFWSPFNEKQNSGKRQKISNHIIGFIVLYVISLLGALLINPHYKWSFGTTGIAISLYAAGLLLLYYFNAHLKAKILDKKNEPVIIRILLYICAILFLAFLFAAFRHIIAESLRDLKFTNIAKVPMDLKMHMILIVTACVGFSGVLERRRGQFYKDAYLKERSKKQAKEGKASMEESSKSSNEPPPFKVFNGRLLEKRKDDLKYIQLAEIVFIESEGNTPRITLLDGSSIIGNYALKHYQEVLKEHNFLRVHRSFIINSSFLDSIDKDDMIHLKHSSNIKEIPLAATFKKEVLSHWRGDDEKKN